MDFILNSLSGLGSFAIYFGGALVSLLIFKFLYLFITPHDELALVKEKKNTAAAWGLGGAIIGFAIAMGGAIANSVDEVDFIIWGVIALVSQLIAFAIVRFFFLPEMIQRIENDEVPVGILLGSTSIAIGILNAACMTY